jgi:cobaltochelatase CobN
MWAAPEAAVLEALRELYLQSETLLESRGETSRGAAPSHVQMKADL